MAELYCPTHGPYDASFGQCPYCTDLKPGMSARSAGPADDSPTEIGGHSGSFGAFGGSEDPTEIGQSFQKGGFDYEEKTELGRASSRVDETELDHVVEGSLAILWVTEGPNRGRIYKVDGGTVIGRTEGSIVLDDPKTSNPHAKITKENESYIIWDFGSKNGTYVNGEKIRAATALKENDIVKIGDTSYVFKVQ